MFSAKSSSAAKGKGKVLVGDKRCQVTSGMGASCRLFEGGRSIRSLVGFQSSTVMSYGKCERPKIKVDKELDQVMGLGGGLKIDYKLNEFRAHVIPNCVVSPDQRETGSKGTKFSGLGTNLGCEVIA